MKGFKQFIREKYSITKKDKKDLVDIDKVVEDYCDYMETEIKCPECGSTLIVSTTNGHACVDCEYIF